MEEKEIKITDKFIKDLFENETFKEKLNEYIISNITIRQDYNAYEGTYDDITVSFAGNEIYIESKSYGI